jgi:hypothetical protein
MKTHLKYLSIALLTALALVSCQKDGLIVYEKKPDIFFTGPGIVNNQFRYTSSSVKFIDLPGNVYNDTIMLSFMGALAEYDRPVKVAVYADSTTALEGVHYRIVEAVVPANSHTGYVLVHALRAESSEQSHEVRLSLRLEPNVHFGTDFNVLLNNTSERKEQSTIDFEIYVSNTLTKPWVWIDPISRSIADQYWGEFSFAKYNVILLPEVSGMPPCFWDNMCSHEGRTLFPHTDVPPVAVKLRLYLQQRFLGIIPGGAVVDEDGDLVTVPRFWQFPEEW